MSQVFCHDVTLWIQVFCDDVTGWLQVFCHDVTDQEKICNGTKIIKLFTYRTYNFYKTIIEAEMR